jgi:hypothetical protein
MLSPLLLEVALVGVMMPLPFGEKGAVALRPVGDIGAEVPGFLYKVLIYPPPEVGVLPPGAFGPVYRVGF